MLYLGIDQHANQLTIDLGDELGKVLVNRRVSTAPSRLTAFLTELQERSADEGGYAAIVEVTGFNDYLLKLLPQFGCSHVLLVQPQESSKRKSDRRDARQLRELLWGSRHRLLAGKRVSLVRVITPPSPEEAKLRQLTSLLRQLKKQRTQVLNRMHTILKKHNFQHELPAKRLDAVKSQAWLEHVLELEDVDRLEMNLLQENLKHFDKQIAKIDLDMANRFVKSQPSRIVASTPGLSVYSSLVISSRIGQVNRFANGDALANFLGLTPSSRNSDQTIRHGGVTKLGSGFVRHMLCQSLVHVLRKDPWIRKWYRKTKSRRGVSVARVAVMRRLATILYAMLRDEMPYVPGGPDRYQLLLKLRDQRQLTFEEVWTMAYQDSAKAS
tara:strand:- start:665 stop:1813 length:1149 start_codon:yes stop_codon:yes gene_type:complete